MKSSVVFVQHQPFQFYSVCSETMAKRLQQDSGEERVTAKSRPMMNLVARTPSFVSSSTSVSRGKKHYGSQDPWKSVAGEDRSGRPDKGTDLFEASDHHYHEQFMESFSSASYSKWDYDRAWSSQEWKADIKTCDRLGQPDKTSWRMVQQVRPDHEEILLDGIAQSVRYGETLRDRSGQPDNIDSQEVANSQNFIMGSDAAELELSVESRSFVNRVNDQVRKRQKIISIVTGNVEEHSMIWGMFMAVALEPAIFMGKNFQDNQNSIVNTADLTLKQVFDISAKLVSEQEEISLPEKNGKSVHCEEMVTGTGRPVATKQKEQSNPRLLSFSKMFVPIAQRKWKDIPAVDYVSKGSPMTDFQEEEYQDVSKPRQVRCKNKWKVFQHAIFWTSLTNAQDKG